MNGFVLLLIVVGLSMFGAVYALARLRQERQRYVEVLPKAVVQVNLLDNDDAVVVAEGRGRLVFANPKARAWFGLNGGEPDLELMADAVQPADTFLELFSKEGQASFRIGTRRVEATSHYIPRPDAAQIVVVMREMASTTGARDVLDPVQAMNVVSEIAAAISGTQRLEEVLDEVLNIIGSVIPFDVAEITLWDEDLEVLRPRGKAGDPKYYEQFDNSDGVYRMDDSFSGWIARYRQPLLIADVGLRPDVQHKLQSYPLRSFVGVPLIIGERFIGTLELGSKARVAFDHEDLALLQAVGAQVGIAIENARLQQNQTERAAELTGLQQIAGVMTSLRDRRQMYAQLTGRVALLMNVEMCGVLLFDPAQEALVGQPPFHGVPDAIVSMYRIPLQDATVTQALYNTRDWWYSNDVRGDDVVQQAGLLSLAEAVGVRTTALARMTVGTKQFGVLQVSNKRDGSGFSENDMRLLSVFASQAAIVVENARLYDEEQRRTEELRGLQQISQAVRALQSPDELYGHINQRIAKLMNVQMCGVLLHDDMTGQLISRPPFHGVDSELIRHYRIAITPGSMFHRLYTESDYWISNELRSDPILRDSGLDKLAMLIGVRQTMMVPLVVGGRRLGVVQVSNRIDGADFTEDDARVLSIFAAQAAVIIDNARLYRQMRQRAEESEGLRRVAETASSNLPLTEIIHTVVEDTAKLFGCDVCTVALLDDRTGELTIRPEWVSGVPHFTEPLIMDTYSPGFHTSVVMSGHAFYSNAVRSDSRVLSVYRAVAERFELEAMAQVPLLIQGRGVGELTVASRGGREFTESDMRLLQAVAAQLAAAVDRQRLYQATDADLRARIAELDAVARISNELNRTTEFDRIIDVIRGEAARTTNAVGASIALLRPAEEWENLHMPTLDRRFGLADVLADLAPIERRAIGLRELVAVDAYDEADLQPQPVDAQSAIAAPVIYSEQVAGVLHLYSTEPNAFPIHTQDYVRTLVNQIAITIGNEARYREQLERAALLKARTEQLNQIFELGRMLTTGESIEDVLEAVAHAVSDAIGFNVVVMSLVDRRLGVTRRVAMAGLPLSQWEEIRKVTPSLSNLDILLKPVYQISGSYFLPGDDRSWQQPELPFVVSQVSMPVQGPRAWRSDDLMLVPLRNSRGEMVGLMSVDDPRDGMRPNLRTVEALETFAYQAAFAIENYQLVQAYQAEAEAARRERDRLARLHLVASEIQRATDIPSRLQVVADGIRAAGWGRVAITLRDVNYDPQEVITSGYTPDEASRLRASLLSGRVWSQRLSDPELRNYRVGEAYYLRYSDPWMTENKVMAGLGEDDLQTLPQATPLRVPAASPTPDEQWHPLDMVYLPLYGLDRTRLIGIISMDSPADGKAPTEASMRPIELFAAQAASAIENTRLYQGMLNAAQQEARINEVMETVSSTLDLDEIIVGVATGLQQMIPFTHMTVARLNDQNPDTFDVLNVTVDVRGNVQVAPGEGIAVENSALGLAARESLARVYHVTDPVQMDTLLDLSAWHAAGERTSMVVPMVAGGRVVGALHMGSTLSDAFGFESQLELVGRVANLTAVAIENAQLLQQTIDRERFSTALSRVGQSATNMLDMTNVLDTICDESMNILSVSGAYVWLVEGDMLLGLAARGPNAEKFAGLRVPLAEAEIVAGAVIRDQRPTFVNTVSRADRSNGHSPIKTIILQDVPVYAMLGVPLLREGRAIGAITFIQTEPDATFTDRDVEKASAFAVQAAIAIQNARLYQETLDLTSFNESIIQSIQQGIIVIDRDLRIRTVNAFMRQSYGWTDEALGMLLFAYRPEYADYLADAVSGVLQSGRPRTLDHVQSTDADGERAIRNFYIYPLREGETVSGLVILLEDITQRAALEADVEVRARQLSVLTEVSSQLTATLEPDAVINLVFDQLDRILQYDSATLWLRRDDKLVIRAARGYADADALVGIEAEIADSELFHEIAQRGQVLNIHDITQDKRFPPGQEPRSWLGVSLVSRGNLAGLLVLEKFSINYYTPTMEQLALTFANQVAVALENAALFQRITQTAEENTQLYRETATRARELDQQARRLTLLYRVSNALTQTLDTEDIFEVALRETIEMLGVDHGSAFIFEPERHVARLVIEYPRGDKPPEEDDVIALDDNALIGEVRRTLQPVVIRDVPHDSRLAPLQSIKAQRRVLSHMAVPLTVGGQLIGIMGFDATSEYREFRPEQIEVAQTIALQAGIAVQNANLLEQSFARTRELETLFEATQSISATLNLNEVMRSIAMQMVVALQVDGCEILNWDQETNELTSALYVNADGSMPYKPGVAYPVADYPMRARALQLRQMILVRADDANLNAAERAWLTQYESTSCIVMPMIVREQAIGLIELHVKTQGRNFIGTEVRLARTLAAQAAVSIENAALQTETASKLAELFVINELSTSLAAAIDEQQIYEIVRLRLPELVQGQTLLLAVIADDDVTLTYPVALHEGKSVQVQSHAIGDDEVSFVIRNRTPQRLVGDEIADVLRNQNAQQRLLQSRCFLGVPLISGDEVVGALILSDDHNPRAFNLNDQRILSTVGAQLAIALQNARLFGRTLRFANELELAVQQRTDELQRERDSINFLYQLTTNLTSSLDIDIALNRVLEMMADAVGAEMGLILGIDNIADSLVFRAGLNMPYREGEPVGYSPREGLPGWVLQTQQAIVVPDVQLDYRWLRIRESDNLPRAAIAALLEANEENLGVVMLFSREPNRFSADQLPLVTAAAKQIASAMNNADLYGLIREQAERLGAMVRREQVDSTKNLAIVESIADGVMVANQDGDVTQFNSAAERILDLPRRKVIGSHISTLSGLYASAGGRHWLEAIERWTADPTQHRAGEEVRAQFSLESGKVVSVILSPVNMGDQFLGTVSVFRDITREIEVDRMKSEFVATVSHELRTPMTSIKGYADLLLLGAAGAISDTQKRFLTTIKTNADRLSVLVNELLDISRIDRGVVRLNVQPIDLNDAVEHTLRHLQERMAAESKRIELHTHIPKDLPLLRADFDKLVQILQHLADNAFNYTHTGGRIDIGAQAEEETVLVTVADTGVGIAKEKQANIWNRFYRDEEQPLVMETSGAGLGLAIVKEYVEMHEGQIWLESEVGEGTTVYVRIPAFIPES